MKRSALFSLATVGGLGGLALFVPLVRPAQAGVAPAPDERIRDGVTVAGVKVGGLAPDEARKALRGWWDAERRKEAVLRLNGKNWAKANLSTLGYRLDDEKTVAALPLRSLMGGGDPQEFPPVYAWTLPDTKPWDERFVANQKETPARVVWRKGAVVRTPEGVRSTVDWAKTLAPAGETPELPKTVDLAVVPAPRRVTDEDLKKITGVVASYSTSFSAGNRPRSSNIRLAASFFDGRVLMPGDRISYNDVVGRRTLRRGFKVAGVYIDGKHDTGVGGGICQVSTTLYNAALFADLKPVGRRNHSLPVPYVPLGRDATVDYGNIDLVIENSSGAPIAIQSDYRPGRLTFYVLGRPEPGKKVRITQSGVAYGGSRTKTVLDPNLPRGRRVVRESGRPSRSVRTYRTVIVNGVETKRETLGSSIYIGQPRLIAVGTARPKPVPPPSTTVTVAPGRTASPATPPAPTPPGPSTGAPGTPPEAER